MHSVTQILEALENIMEAKKKFPPPSSPELKNGKKRPGLNYAALAQEMTSVVMNDKKATADSLRGDIAFYEEDIVDDRSMVIKLAKVGMDYEENLYDIYESLWRIKLIKKLIKLKKAKKK